MELRPLRGQLQCLASITSASPVMAATAVLSILAQAPTAVPDPTCPLTLAEGQPPDPQTDLLLAPLSTVSLVRLPALLSELGRHPSHQLREFISLGSTSPVCLPQHGPVSSASPSFTLH